MTDGAAWGIADGYHDAGGVWQDTPAEATAAVLAAMGADGDAPPAPPPMWFVRAGETHPMWGPCQLVLEDGTDLGTHGALPGDVPLGYHDLIPNDGGPTTRLVITPGRCTLPERAWGFSAQLYALRSAASWGIGDLGDLRDLARWSASVGARSMLLNPLHANAPVSPQEPSPYFASSRRFRNILALRIADVPGARELASELAAVDVAARALNTSATIDRDAVLTFKLAALGHVWDDVATSTVARAAFDAWRANRGLDLERFATYCALTELYGASWPAWPVSLRRPDAGGVAQAAEQLAPRIEFHAWCQWLLDQQMATAAAQGVGLIGDLAVGFRPDGYDAWCDQDLLASGCRIGAPPDTFNPGGQDWGLPPYIPWKLRAARYEPFIAALRANLTHLAGLRIDHVMGLFRLYWIPPSAPAGGGAYVRYPSNEIFDLLALEAARAGAFVVGEDLGTVEEGVGEELAERQLLGCKLVWFEKDPPAKWPTAALGTVTTHDLPTAAGVWTGADPISRKRVGVAEDPDAQTWFRSRLRLATGLVDGAPVDDVLVGVHRALSASPALIRLATLDDCVAALEPPNMPGTVDERPNWRLPLPMTLEQLMADPTVAEIAAAMNDGNDAPAEPPSAAAADVATDDVAS